MTIRQLLAKIKKLELQPRAGERLAECRSRLASTIIKKASILADYGMIEVYQNFKFDEHYFSNCILLDNLVIVSQNKGNSLSWIRFHKKYLDYEDEELEYHCQRLNKEVKEFIEDLTERLLNEKRVGE